MRPIAPLLSLALTASTFEISAAWMLGAAARRPLVLTASRIATMAEATPPRELTEENARAVLQECMDDLGTLFGSNAESLAVGITGAADFVDLEGPILVISLSGRFWHQRSMVVERVKKYVMDRIPECVDVEIVDSSTTPTRRTSRRSSPSSMPRGQVVRQPSGKSISTMRVGCHTTIIGARVRACGRSRRPWTLPRSRPPARAAEGGRAPPLATMVAVGPINSDEPESDPRGRAHGRRTRDECF